MGENEEGAVTMRFDQKEVSGGCGGGFRRRRYIPKQCQVGREEEMDQADFIFTEFREGGGKTNVEGVWEQVQSKSGTPN